MRELVVRAERIKDEISHPEGAQRLRELVVRTERIKDEMSHPEGAQRLRELPGSKIIPVMANFVYTVYILTNKHKNVLYTGVTSKLKQHLHEHKNGTKGWFTKKYSCYILVYYEHFRYIITAIDRETEIKGWSREKKESLINKFNPEWKFLNEEIGEI